MSYSLEELTHLQSLVETPEEKKIREVTEQNSSKMMTAFQESALRDAIKKHNQEAKEDTNWGLKAKWSKN